MILPEAGRGTIRRRANGGGGASLRKPTVYLARKLRRQITPPEALLWSHLRGSKLGLKVRRQHPIGPYVADFFIGDANLVVEVDGSPHDYGDQPERDRIRDHYLPEHGLRVLRINAADVMNNLEGALRLIAAEARNPLHHPSDGPPPHAGEEH